MEYLIYFNTVATIHFSKDAKKATIQYLHQMEQQKIISKPLLIYLEYMSILEMKV